ncbi:transposase, partial [Streptomyces arboris]
MTAAASTELSPRAIAFQNLTRSSRQATLGRPGEGICPRYSRTARCRFPTPITNPQLTKVLRRPIESAQYTSRAFAEICRSAGVRQSMGAIGSSADNAAAESFNAALKRETLKGRKGWPSEGEARLDAFRWLTRYNTRRRHSRLGQRSPIAYENAI